MSKEIKSLTGIRGIAALWVVFYHVIYAKGDNAYLNVLKEFFSKGYLAVDVFFLLSATVMCMAYEKTFSGGVRFTAYKEYMLKRFIRIYPAYIFWEIGYNVFVRNFGFFTIIINMLLLQNLFNKDLYTISIVLWSLSVEWIIYFIYPFLLRFFVSVKTLYILFAIVILGFVLLYTLPDWSNYYISSNGISAYKPTGNHSVVKGTSSILRCLICYVIGTAGFFLMKSPGFSSFFKKDAVYYGTLVLFVIGFFPNTNIFLVVISWFLILCLKERAFKSSFFSTKIVYFLGQVSYSLYILHMLILVALSIIIKHYLGGDFMLRNHIWIIVSTLLLLVPASYVSYVFIEKGGAKFLRKILLKKQSDQVVATEHK